MTLAGEERSDVEDAADYLLSKDHHRVVSHADADGASSAALICLALEANDVAFTYSPLMNPEDVVDADADVYCDVGASYVEELEDCLVVDHHEGGDAGDTVVSVVDASASSAAEKAYEVACALDVDRPDVAVIGGCGDDGASMDTIERGRELGLVSETGGLRFDTGDPSEALAHSIEPYTRLSGDFAAAQEFVEELGVDGVGGVDEDGRLETAVTLLASEEGAAEAVEELTGAFELEMYGGRPAKEVAAAVEACGRTGKGGLGFSILLGAGFEDAFHVKQAFESGVVSAVENAEEDDRDGFLVVRTMCRHTSAVADVYTRWIDGGVEELVVVDVENGRASLRSKVVDCASLAEEAAEKVDGDGGGHRGRAGATFPSGSVSDFVDAVEEGWR